MTEIIFLVKEAEEGGFTAEGLNAPVFTQGETIEELRENLKEAVETYLEGKSGPVIIRLHIVKDEAFTL